MARRKSNKADIPLKSVDALANEVAWETYNYKGKFKYLCKIVADCENEKLLIKNAVDESMTRSCVYVMVINGKIFKIGVALRGVKSRVGSYNCGKTTNRMRGTASTTNYWVLQSFINLATDVHVYAYFVPTKRCKIFGEMIEEPFPSAKSVEGVLLKKFIAQYKQKPIGNTQR